MIQFNRSPNAYSAFTDRAVQSRQKEIARLQAQIGTGKRVQQASDDPEAFAGARKMDQLSSRLTQHQNTIASARPWADHSQQALDRIAERLATALEKGVQGANGTLDDAARESLAEQMEGLRDEVFDQLNAKFGDEYLFAGTATNTAPFARDPDTGVVSYEGNDGTRTRRLSDNITLDVNIGGSDLFTADDGTTLTDALQTLADALRSGDADTISTALGGVETMHSHALGKGAEAGAIANRLTTAEDVVREAMFNAESHRSTLEDTDLAHALTKMQEAQTGLQAALKVTAGMLQTTLLDYLR